MALPAQAELQLRSQSHLRAQSIPCTCLRPPQQRVKAAQVALHLSQAPASFPLRQVPCTRVDVLSCCADHAERLRSQVQHLKAELMATATAHEEEEARLTEVC